MRWLRLELQLGVDRPEYRREASHREGDGHGRGRLHRAERVDERENAMPESREMKRWYLSYGVSKFCSITMAGASTKPTAYIPMKAEKDLSHTLPLTTPPPRSARALAAEDGSLAAGTLVATLVAGSATLRADEVARAARTRKALISVLCWCFVGAGRERLRCKPSHTFVPLGSHSLPTYLPTPWRCAYVTRCRPLPVVLDAPHPAPKKARSDLSRSRSCEKKAGLAAPGAAGPPGARA